MTLDTKTHRIYLASAEFAPAAPGDHPACERILRALPRWFGIEAALVGYVTRLPELAVRVARADDDLVGFIAIEQHTKHAAEIHVMAVVPREHGGGIGRALVAHVEHELRAAGVDYLQVKTLSASSPDPSYAMTRRFYDAFGFVALEEHATLWGASNPALQMIKRL